LHPEAAVAPAKPGANACRIGYRVGRVNLGRITCREYNVRKKSLDSRVGRCAARKYYVPKRTLKNRSWVDESTALRKRATGQYQEKKEY
jgi:hypothetical protein